MSYYFEDIELGERVCLGSHRFRADAIKDFARKYDPQLFHIDEDAGKASLFKGLAASGWHTFAVFIRMLIDERRRQADYMIFRGERPAIYGPSPGFENIEWKKPVLAGHTITFYSAIVEKRELNSRPTRGLLVCDNEGIDESGEVVFKVRTKVLVERRAPAEG